MRFKTNRLWLPIVIHVAWDFWCWFVRRNRRDDQRIVAGKIDKLCFTFRRNCRSRSLVGVRDTSPCSEHLYDQDSHPESKLVHSRAVIIQTWIDANGNSAIKFAVSAYVSVQLSLMVCLLFSSRRLISRTASETVIPSTVAHSWESTSWVTRRKAAIVPLSGLCAP
jgi:hypothetical protein